ncbi:MAG: hypothetical protein KIT72_05465 [Polyangiaceae bacterium]|nr:hypothetical protein [Polyangiaceae bacterium]MCW5789847.1 hypothetical protein [Polyangiaceae bacterium]
MRKEDDGALLEGMVERAERETSPSDRLPLRADPPTGEEDSVGGSVRVGQSLSAGAPVGPADGSAREVLPTSQAEGLAHGPVRGVQHYKSTEELLAFAAIPPLEKLRWLESVRRLVNQLPPETQAIMQKFRRGAL